MAARWGAQCMGGVQHDFCWQVQCSLSSRLLHCCHAADDRLFGLFCPYLFIRSFWPFARCPRQLAPRAAGQQRSSSAQQYTPPVHRHRTHPPRWRPRTCRASRAGSPGSSGARRAPAGASAGPASTGCPAGGRTGVGGKGGETRGWLLSFERRTGERCGDLCGESAFTRQRLAAAAERQQKSACLPPPWLLPF
jgi:hypothetical protein